MALISFRSYLLFLSTLEAVFIVLLTFARPQLYAAYGAPGKMPADGDTFWEWLAFPLILVSGLFCISSRVNDKRLQRDICCTLATVFFFAIACRFIFAAPVYGKAVVIPSVITDVVMFAPAFWLLFSGFGVKGKRPPVPGSLFRYSMLAGACVCFAFGLCEVFAPGQFWSAYTDGTVTSVTPEGRYAMALTGLTSAIAIPGLLCNLSSTVDPVLRNNTLKVCFVFSAVAIVWRLSVVNGLIFPESLARWTAMGIPEAALWKAIAGDFIWSLPFTIPFVYYIVLGNGKAKVAIE